MPFRAFSWPQVATSKRIKDLNDWRHWKVVQIYLIRTAFCGMWIVNSSGHLAGKRTSVLVVTSASNPHKWTAPKIANYPYVLYAFFAKQTTINNERTDTGRQGRQESIVVGWLTSECRFFKSCLSTRPMSCVVVVVVVRFHCFISHMPERISSARFSTEDPHTQKTQVQPVENRIDVVYSWAACAQDIDKCSDGENLD